MVAARVDADGIDEDGEPVAGATWSGMCNWQDATIEKYGRDRAETKVAASLYIDGDAFPSLAVVAGGTVDAMGATMEIVRGTKARNPDGTVNYTRLELV